jgi:hypothetical protein
MTQQPQYPQVYPPAPRPASGARVGRIVLLIVVLAVTCFGGIALGAFFAQPEASSTSSADSSASIGEGPASASAGAPKVVEAVPSVEDGVWTVGVDMPAGKYRTTANVDSRCYWQISKTGGDGLGDIVANDLPGGGRPQVTLKAGQDFKTDNCGTWHKVK